jgi:uncharacterized membrane protein YfcA
MVAIGLLLGFVGAGGSGFIISILTVGFGYSIHTVLGTALLAMMFSSISGAISHYREGNIDFKPGLVVGCFGAIGAWIGSIISVGIPEQYLNGLTATMLIISGLMLWSRFLYVKRKKALDISVAILFNLKYWLYAIAIGIVTGLLSGIFGIGSTPFIQIGLMTLLGMSVRYAAGTTMLIIIPIACSGGIGFYRMGYFDVPLLAQVSFSIMLGSYIGAKFTKLVPAYYLKLAIVMVPIIGGCILLFS